MIDFVDGIHSLADLKAFIHRKLCEKENLLPEEFSLLETQLKRGGRTCGMRFAIKGPRAVRLGAIWEADRNCVYLYDSRGVRFQKLQLRSCLKPVAAAD